MSPAAVIGAVVIITFVWLLAGVPSPRARALLYVIPIAITVSLLASAHEPVTSQHVWSVGLLVAFMRGAAAIDCRWEWPIAGTLCTAVAGYVATAAAVTRLPDTPVVVPVVVLTAAWWWLRGWDRRRPLPVVSVHASVGDARRFGVIVATTVIAFACGAALGPVTTAFPYSGIPVAYDSRSALAQLAQSVTRNAILLVVFFTAMAATPPAAGFWAALAAGWGGFTVGFLVLLWVDRRHRVGAPGAVAPEPLLVPVIRPPVRVTTG